MPWARRAVVGATFVVILIIVGLAFLAYLGMQTHDDARRIEQHVTAAKSALLSGDSRVATREAQQADRLAHNANASTSNPAWSAAAAVPWLGSPLRATHEMTSALVDLTDGVLVPSAQLADKLSPGKLRSGDHAIDTAPMVGARDRLSEITSTARSVQKRVDGIDGSWLGPVSRAHADMVVQVDRAASLSYGSSVAARLLPDMLGANGARNYFVALQTPSESRGTGGLTGGYLIVNATGGKVSAPESGRNVDLDRPSSPQVDLGDDYDDLYSSIHPYTDTRNSNISPSFPDAARIWIANWRAQTGVQLDGAIAVDPIALSYVLRVSGPVTLPGGEKITADNVVPITLSTAYTRFANDQGARKAYLQSISRAVFDQVLRTGTDTGQLLEALGRGVSERRIMVYSNDNQEQKLLATTDLAHELDESGQPLLDVTVTNTSGNKLDYYLRRRIAYHSGSCRQPRRQSSASITLTNTVSDLTLPDYVVGSMGAMNQDIPRGTNVSGVQIALTSGAQIESVSVDGHSALYSQGSLRDHPVVMAKVPVEPGKSTVLTVTFTEPTSAHGAPVVPVQPLVDTPVVTVDVPACAKGDDS